MKFENLELEANLLRAVQAEGYETPTPIQVQAIPHVIGGRDVLGCAQTGTGKTAAFALPTMQRLMSVAPRSGRRTIRGLVLAPTRELAAQIGQSFATYGRYAPLRHTVIYGGVGQGAQVTALRHGVDILVATPGRLLDLMQQRHVLLSSVEILILDEADQMLDMGFLPDLKRIVSHVPRKRQTLMFSATMPAEIRTLANQWLTTPVAVQVAPVATPVERIRQSVVHVEPRDKPHLLAHFVKGADGARTLVFTRTKRGADKVARHLEQSGIRAAAIHGNKSQGARQRALDQFRSTKPPVLVATDIAARGLDIDDIAHVVNFDMPQVAEIYVHRIGRTGRAGADGSAVSFCGREERGLLRDIERLTRRSIPVDACQIATTRESDVPETVDTRRPVGARPGSNARRPVGAGGARRPAPPRPHSAATPHVAGARSSRRRPASARSR